MGGVELSRDLRTFFVVYLAMMATSAMYVYLLASAPRGTLYIGVTSNLVRRAFEHRTKAVPGFTEKYNVTRLVYFEEFGDALSAITREKQMKKWLRAWKIELIEKSNPDWHDLYPGIAS